MDIPEAFNLFEGFFWIAIGIGIVIAQVRRPTVPVGLAAGACVFFVAFGASDFVEVHTGVWWEPWWLVPRKGACLGGLLWAGLVYRKHRRSRVAKPTAPTDQSGPNHGQDEAHRDAT